jgi:hypothetical protein
MGDLGRTGVLKGLAMTNEPQRTPAGEPQPGTTWTDRLRALGHELDADGLRTVHLRYRPAAALVVEAERRRGAGGVAVGRRYDIQELTAIARAARERRGTGRPDVAPGRYELALRLLGGWIDRQGCTAFEMGDDTETEGVVARCTCPRNHGGVRLADMEQARAAWFAAARSRKAEERSG